MCMVKQKTAYEMRIRDWSSNVCSSDRRGEGSRIEDLRGRWYVDYVCGAGALVLGHAHPAVVAAVQEQAAKGVHFFGTVNEACVRLAAELVEAIPCAENLAFTTTGGEATFSAISMARAFTGPDNLLTFEGASPARHHHSP